MAPQYPRGMKSDHHNTANTRLLSRILLVLEDSEIPLNCSELKHATNEHNGRTEDGLNFLVSRKLIAYGFCKRTKNRYSNVKYYATMQYALKNPKKFTFSKKIKGGM